MYQVTFDPQGPPLEIEITYLGAITASYVYKLWEANSNAKVTEQAGNNQNGQDDRYLLPVPVSANTNRLVEVFSTMKNADTADLKSTVRIEVCQGATTLDKISETEEIGAGKTVPSQIFIKLTT